MTIMAIRDDCQRSSIDFIQVNRFKCIILTCRHGAAAAHHGAAARPVSYHPSLAGHAAGRRRGAAADRRGARGRHVSCTAGDGC